MTQSATTRSQPISNRRRTGFLRKLFRHPPHRLAGKILKKTVETISNARKRSHDINCCTYSEPATDRKIASYFPELDLGFCKEASTELERACGLYLEHKFDLLGSGWVQVHHGMNCAGFRGCNYAESSRVDFDRDGEWLQWHISKANLPFSRTLWKLLDDDYTPIDWQRDFKSGYRWSEKTWHKDIPLGHLPGVDIKAPWELARMQHLPQIAICYIMLQGDPEERSFCERLQREFQNEILDFIATNPPRFGVNWNSAMDAGIRIANWLLASDLFQAGGATFDEEFEAYFTASVYDHALHIVENLENTGEVVGNHYLADLAGLFFAAAYLPSNCETDRWLNFAWSELLQEIDRQFLPDGTNFEASTCYHCLSSEIVVWCVALHSAIDPSRFHDEHQPHFHGETSKESGLAEKLQKMRDFIEHVKKPNRNIHQVGDNDSGRFFKLNPAWKIEEKNDLQILRDNDSLRLHPCFPGSRRCAARDRTRTR